MKSRLNLAGIVAIVAVASASLGAIAARTAENGSPSIAKDSRFFEMRTYTAAPGKLEALHARFRDHTNPLFKKHGMTLVGYWVPTDKEKGAENTLVYILGYPSREAREKSWQGFVNDPEWKTARAASEVNGKLVDKVDAVYLNATDYSPIK
ncbi:MAG: hypothetical protein K0Q72_630 [Armatimonadetes bacterium]|nr:hypothetical protein [Armatimonadota bacterium]